MARTIVLPAQWAVTVGGDTFTVDTAKLSDELVARLAEHGFAQKVRDAYNSPGKTGAVATKRQRAGEVIVNLESGEWAETAGRTSDPVEQEARRLYAAGLPGKRQAAVKAAMKWREHLAARVRDAAAKAGLRGDAVEASVAKNIESHLAKARALVEARKAALPDIEL